MRDPSLYTPEKCWTEEESLLADNLLRNARACPSNDLAVIMDDFKTAHTDADDALVDAVAAKLETFPHVFEVAQAQGSLAEYDLSGNRREENTKSITHLKYQGWSVPLRELDSFLTRGALPPSMLEFFLKLMRPLAYKRQPRFEVHQI